MKHYLASYVLSGISHGSFIFAENRETADLYAIQRNLGEKVAGEVIAKDFDEDLMPLPSKLYKNRDVVAALHALMFYSWVSCRAKIYSEAAAENFLRDDSLLHKMVHELHHPNENSFNEDLYDQLCYLEMLIPGMETYDPRLSQATKAVQKVTVVT